MEVIAHEVAHALAPTKKPTSLLDRRGDAGEQTAYGASTQFFRHFVDGGMRGQIPRLQPAHGGTALIHRHQIEGPWNINDPAHETMTEESLRRAGLIDKNDTYRSESAWDYTRGQCGTTIPRACCSGRIINRAPPTGQQLRPGSL